MVSWRRQFVISTSNAVILVDDNVQQNTAIIELFSPIYDSDKKALNYEIIPDNASFIELPNEFGKQQ